MLIISDWKPLTIVKKSLHKKNPYIKKSLHLSPSTNVNVELLSNVDKINTLNSKNNSEVMIKSYDVSCEFNPFRNNPEIEFQADGAYFIHFY